MAKSSPDLTIRSLRGGLNTDDPASELRPDQCTEAMNVEFHTVPCGERRRGCASINQGAYANLYDSVPLLARHLPTDDESAAQLWMIGMTGAGAVAFNYKDTAWHTVSPIDAAVYASAYGARAVSFHKKLFLAFDSTVDRLHVWDGTSLRRVGVATPAAPTAANTAGAGTFSGTRYYRVRYTVQNGSGTTLRRSEPSTALTFAPSGAKDGVTVTKPATITEGETHWELEASVDNAFFYRIATTVVGTTTYTDNVAFSTGYALSGVLSADSGDYTVPGSAKLLAVDEDRLVMAGSWEDAGLAVALGSRVSWTPVNGDPGSGNDERIPISTTNFLDLDAGEGGSITDISQPSNGFFFVFKWSHIYKMVRTGIRDQAYAATVVSKTMGAIPGSVVSGVDEFGRSCIYALDPSLGLYRIGANGLQRHHGLGSMANSRSTWASVNTDAATVICRSVYYADAQQVKWFIATGTSEIPDLEIVLQTDAVRATENETGIEGGLSLADGDITNVVSACLFAENIDAGVARSKVLKPFVGTTGIAATASIRMLDTGTTDDGTAYVATLTSAPFISAGFLNRFGTLSAGVMAMAAAGVTVVFDQARNYGVGEKPVTIDLSPTASETEVIRVADSSGFADMQALQIILHDATPATGRWEVVQIALAQSAQEKANA
jgi:hypothetical protein